MAALSLTGNDIHKAEMENYRKFGHTLGSIQHIDFMSRIDIFYTTLSYNSNCDTYTSWFLIYQELC